MPGNREGGLKAKEKIYAHFGPDWYRKIGAKRGYISRGGGFAKDPKLASRAGKKGRKVSLTRRRKIT